MHCLQEWILDLPDTQALLDINTGRLYPKAQLFKRRQAMQPPPRFSAGLPSPNMSPIGSPVPLMGGMQKPAVLQGTLHDPDYPPPPPPLSAPLSQGQCERDVVCPALQSVQAT